MLEEENKVSIHKVHQNGMIEIERYVSIKKDGVEVTKIPGSNEVVHPCVKIDGVWKDYDFSTEPELLKNLCSGIWTDELKTQYKADQDVGSLV